MGEVVQTTPTIGFNVETVTRKNITFSVWDVGGQDQVMPPPPQKKLWPGFREFTVGFLDQRTLETLLFKYTSSYFCC